MEMLQQLKNNFKKEQATFSIALPVETAIQSIKKCNHRNQNGWCNKSKRQCPLIKTFLINQ
jgi:hypothetical protein